MIAQEPLEEGLHSPLVEGLNHTGIGSRDDATEEEVAQCQRRDGEGSEQSQEVLSRVACKHTHTCALTHTHTHLHTCTDTLTYTHLHIHVHTYAYTNRHVHRHAHLIIY
jgi:hypothetical protein